MPPKRVKAAAAGATNPKRVRVAAADSDDTEAGGGGAAAAGAAAGSAATAAAAPPTVVLTMSSDGEHLEDDLEDEDLEDMACYAQSVSARFTVSGFKRRGRIEADLVHRDLLRMSFHEVCDEHSEELQAVGCEFCDEDGVCSRVDVDDESSDSGGFLYIKVFESPEPEGSTAGAAEALRLFLSHPKLRSKWTLAVYIPAARGWQGSGGHRPGSAAHRAWANRGIAADMRAFFRVGFVQPPRLGARVYITPNKFDADIVPRTHAEALAVPLKPLDRAPLSAADDRQTFRDFCRVMGLQVPPGVEF